MPAVTYRPHYTIGDFLAWEGDWELWDGIPIAMSPAPDFRHQVISGALYTQLKARLSAGNCPAECQAVYESDWHVNDSTVVRPDIMIVCEPPEGRWVEKRPEFIAEILSPSTREKDLVAKRELYAANGVPCYLIIDPEEKSALLLSLDEKGTYRDLPAETEIEIHPDCFLQIDVAALFS